MATAICAPLLTTPRHSKPKWKKLRTQFQLKRWNSIKCTAVCRCKFSKISKVNKSKWAHHAPKSTAGRWKVSWNIFSYRKLISCPFVFVFNWVHVCCFACVALSLLLCARNNFSAASNFLTSFRLLTLNGKGMFVKWRISVIQHFCMRSFLAIFHFSFCTPIACLQQQKFSYFTCLSRWRFCCQCSWVFLLFHFPLLLFFAFFVACHVV